MRRFRNRIPVLLLKTVLYIRAKFRTFPLIKYIADYIKPPRIREWSGSSIPESIKQGSIFRTPYYYENAKRIIIFFKTSNMKYFAGDIIDAPIFNKWYTYIPADIILFADYFDYYIKARGNYRTIQTELRRVYIDKIEDGTTLRVNIDDVMVNSVETVSGVLHITAKNFADRSAPVKMALDEEELFTTNSLENGAFFTFSHFGGKGINMYYKNALIIKKHEDDEYGLILKLFPLYSEVLSLSSQAIKVDSKYFTCHPDGSADIDLYVYVGTNGSPFESFTTAKHDNFAVQKVALSLPDGTTFKPKEYKGRRVTSGPNGPGTVDLGWCNLDSDTAVLLGDTDNACLYVKCAFTIPAAYAKADAYAAKIDTTKLSNGPHYLKLKSGAENKTITLRVGNTVPDLLEPEKIPKTNLPLAVNTARMPIQATVTAGDDDETIGVYAAVTQVDIAVFEGTGDSTASAVRKRNNNASTSVSGAFPYQIYELTADVAETDSIRFEVTAISDYGRDIQIYVLNIHDNTWEWIKTTKLGDDIIAIFPLMNRFVEKKAKVLIQARGTECMPNTKEQTSGTEKNNYPEQWTGRGKHAVPKQFDFSMVWMTDTQEYSGRYTWHFENIVNWIAKKQDALRIKYVMHTGDLVSGWDEEDEFMNASKYLNVLGKAGIPYGLLAGNHDVANGAEKYEYYWKYFGEDRFKHQSHYGGSYKNNLGHYDLITVNGLEMIIVYMSWDIYYPETEWMNAVLQEYADRKAIIAVHGGIDANAEQSYQSTLLLKEVAAKNKNLIAMINGHYHSAALNVAGFDDDGDGEYDRALYQILTDYQSAVEGGDGYIKMLYFDLANGKIYINSYSPSLNDYNFYHKPKLAEYPIGLSVKKTDIIELDVDFARSALKTLSVNNVKAMVLTDTLLGSAAASKNSATDIQLNISSGSKMDIYARTVNRNGQITAYSPVIAVSN